MTKLSAKTSTVPGSGMDKPGISFFGLSNGGSFAVTLCQEENCCYTGKLNTEDNNWELGQIDWFVGRQIKGCYGLVIQPELPLVLTLHHEGANAGLLDWIKIYSWHSEFGYICDIGERLDYSNSYTTECKLGGERPFDRISSDFGCNGRQEFCSLSFDQFLFPGSHNSGTGQKNGNLKCAYKNQDLNIIEQLEFGIRFFDVDVIFSTLFGCKGLETGHGSNPGIGLYQCYGKVEVLLDQIREWLNNHPSEVVVLNFGNIDWPDETIPILLETLMQTFTKEGVKMNRSFKLTGKWPTLREAVTKNERIFVFVRDSIGAVTENELDMVKEVKVKPDEDLDLGNVTNYEATITTSYKAEDVGSDCSYVLLSNDKACKTENESRTDFLKLSLFSKFGKGGILGTECVHKMARKCNRWIKAVVDQCSYRRFQPSFVLLDYPNYQGLAEQNIVELCHQVNKERVEILANMELELLEQSEEKENVI